MTRPAQKDAERASIVSLLTSLGLPTDIRLGEKPDAIVTIEGRQVGIELTTFQSNMVTAENLSRRQVEAAWETFKRVVGTVQKDRPDLANLNVGLMYSGSGPAPAEHRAFIEEVLAFAAERAATLNDRDVSFWPHGFTSPLMKRCLRALNLRRCAHATWYSSLDAGSFGLPDGELSEIVRRKAIGSFREVDEL